MCQNGAILRRNYGNSDVILNQLIEEVQQQCPVTESRHFQEFANAIRNLLTHYSHYNLRVWIIFFT
jgi:hypothetical protein